MSLESGKDPQNSSQDGGRLLAWGWGTQFAVAITGTVAFLVIWIEGIFPPRILYVRGNLLAPWLVALSLLCPLIACALILWTVKLAWKQRFFMVQWNSLPNRQRAWFAGVFLGAGVLDVAARFVADHMGYAPAGYLGGSRFFIFWFFWTAAFCWAAHRNGRRLATEASEAPGWEVSRAKRTAPVTRWWLSVNNRILIIWLFDLILVLSLPRQGILGWMVFSVLSLVMLSCWAHTGIQAALSRGWYRTAWFTANLLFWNSGQRQQERGWVLLQSGRFKEAREALRKVAFDREGKPNLTSYAFYFYATALMDEGDKQRAAELFDAAVQVPQTTKVFHFGLADCLLSQRKDPERARRLAEEVRRDPLEGYAPEQQSYLRRQCLALEAWSMALEGLRDGSQAKLDEAFEDAGKLRPRDRAGLLQLKAVTLAAMGDTAKAGEAFRDALANCSTGWAGAMARKGLEELESGKL